MERTETELVAIVPKVKDLSGVELATLRHVESEQLRLGLKRTQPVGTPDEKQELDKLSEDLRRQLSVARIERWDGRALAVWDDKMQEVQVLRKDGKFGSFGYSCNGKQYLEYFEAMFLLELNRLQLEYHSTIMSIEQAYVLLLGESASYKYNEYLVYSTLSRVGYILLKYKSWHYTEVTQADCVWQLLFSALQKKPVPGYIKNCQFYAKTKVDMEAIKTHIMQQEKSTVGQQDSDPEEVRIDFNKNLKPSGKRKNTDGNANAERQAKIICASTFAWGGGSLIDFLKNEPEFKQFQQIFNKFDIIKLERSKTCTKNQRKLRINFDLYLHSKAFKKSAPEVPTFRLVIIGPNESFPTHAEISRCHRQQLQPTPLLIMSVNESKQIQAFLYYFI